MTAKTCPACAEGRLCLRHAAGLVTGARPVLDPDQVACSRCGAQPGDVCRAPSGKRAKTVHEIRRADARGETEATVSAKTPPATEESRAKGASAGGKATARKRAARREQIAKTREELELDALTAEAAKLAADAARWMEGEQQLKERVLSVAAKAWARTDDALSSLREPVLDDEGRPTYAYSETARTMVPVERGAWSVRDAKDLMISAAVALDKVLKVSTGVDQTLRLTGDVAVNGRPSSEGLQDDQLAGLLDRARGTLSREVRLEDDR